MTINQFFIKLINHSTDHPINYSMQDIPMPDGNMLREIITMQMPFGKYKGCLLCDLPVAYLEWFFRKGFPKNKLGILLETIYEIKINGLQHLLTPLKK